MKNEPLNRLQSNLSGDAGADPQAAPAESSLDEVRKRLQSYGYLNSRIRSFYLASLSRTASQFFNRCLLCFRVGILTGTVSAILMTTGTLVFNQELLKQKLDLLLLFLYFEVFFVFLFSLLELILMFFVSVWLRFAGGRKLFLAGQLISFLIGLAFFVYFFYWGRTQMEFIRILSNGSITTMLIILIVSCIFVAKCSWLGFLVAFRELEVGRILPNWKRYGIEVMLTVTAVLILLPFVIGGKETGNRETPPVAVITTPDQWIVIGMDGISKEMFERLASEGAAPYLQRISSDSFAGQLEISEPVVPPVSWTSVATGVSPAEHGIVMPEVRRWRGLSSWMQITPFHLAMHSIMVDAGFGQRQPVSGYLRKSKTFWEVLSDSGIRVGVVNWWGSWPARPMRGWNISERYYFKVISGATAQDETFPAELFRRYYVPSKSKEQKVNGLELDRFYWDIFRRQLQKDPVRAAAVYLPGLDILNYEFFEMKRIDPFAYTDLYRKHLQWLDLAIREMHSEMKDYKILLIFYQGRSLSKDHSGILIHAGNVPLKSRAPGIFSELGIAPLILHSCGVPISTSMSSELIRAVIPREKLSEMPVRSVPPYRKAGTQVESAHVGEFNDLLVEQMKSLGYLQ